MTKTERRAQNASYKMLDEQIRAAYIRIIKAEKRIPSKAEVSKECNVAERTIQRHLEQISLTNLVQPYRILGNEVLSGLFKEAVGGNVSAMKLYFMLIYDWSEKQEIEHKGEIKTVIEVRYEDVKCKKTN